MCETPLPPRRKRKLSGRACVWMCEVRKDGQER